MLIWNGTRLISIFTNRPLRRVSSKLLWLRLRFQTLRLRAVPVHPCEQSCPPSAHTQMLFTHEPAAGAGFYLCSNSEVRPHRSTALPHRSRRAAGCGLPAELRGRAAGAAPLSSGRRAPPAARTMGAAAESPAASSGSGTALPGPSALPARVLRPPTAPSRGPGTPGSPRSSVGSRRAARGTAAFSSRLLTLTLYSP